MEYEYEDRPTLKGDIVVWLGVRADNRLISNKQPFLVLDVRGTEVEILSNKGTKTWMGSNNRRVIKTKPGDEATAGDTVIFIVDDIGKCEKGKIYTVQKLVQNTDRKHIRWHPEKPYTRYASDFLVLSQKEAEKQASIKINKTQKENEMNEPTGLHKAIIDDIEAAGIAVEVGTGECISDFEEDKENKVIAKYYNFNGEMVDIQDFQTKKQAKALLSHPKYVGCTVVIFERVAVKKAKVDLEDVDLEDAA